MGEYVTTSRMERFPQPWSYPRNLVPGGPSCRMRLTRLSPSFRGGGAVGRWSLLIHTQHRGGVKKKYEHTRQQCKHTHMSKYTETNSKTHLPQELGPSRSHFYDATSQPLTLHHRRHRGQTVSLHQPACHPRGCRTLSWWYDDSQAIVTATTHGPAPGIYHEADQEAEEKGPVRN